jgi:hypothetical protein
MVADLAEPVFQDFLLIVEEAKSNAMVPYP